MKAIIMAGGEGTRLRPLTCSLPKPMVKMFDRPVAEHIIRLLKRGGFTEICATLQYMPQIFRDYFGDGGSLGVSLSYSVEDEPLGTAGSVRACKQFYGSKSFLVISGDAVCDFDLKRCYDYHIQQNADVTVVLYRHQRPLEYGVVVTDRSGRIEKFIEKPAWGQVLANVVNTGIYIIKPEVMEAVPEGKQFDFSKDLFPKLLREGARLFGCVADGYWCDMGDCEAYLTCVTHALEGRIKLEMDIPQVSLGVWSAIELPASAEIMPPCYIGEGVHLGEGCVIGPDTVLGKGSVIGKRAMVRGSVVDSGKLGDRVRARGAIISGGAVLREGAELREGSVVGQNTIIGKNSLVLERVRIWPNKEIPEGTKVAANLTSGSLKHTVEFEEGGLLRGETNLEVTPELCHLLGAALTGGGKLGISWKGGRASRLMAQALESGCCSAGGEAVEHDAVFLTEAMFASRLYGLGSSVFLTEEGDETYLYFLGKDGLPLGRDAQRRLENQISRGECPRAYKDDIGTVFSTSGLELAYVTGVAKEAPLAGKPMGLEVSVKSDTPPNIALKKVLELMGIGVKSNAALCFEISDSGTELSIYMEDGRVMESSKIPVLLSLLEFEKGCGKVAVLPEAPVAVDILAAGFNAQVLRVGSGDPAYELFLNQRMMYDGVFAAARLCSYLSVTGRTMTNTEARLPKFTVVSREVGLKSDRGALMSALSEMYRDQTPEKDNGIKIKTGGGWVRVAPTAGRSALRITGEGTDTEIAEELCSFFEKNVKRLDGQE